MVARTQANGNSRRLSACQRRAAFKKTWHHAPGAAAAVWHLRGSGANRQSAFSDWDAAHGGKREAGWIQATIDTGGAAHRVAEQLQPRALGVRAGDVLAASARGDVHACAVRRSAHEGSDARDLPAAQHGFDRLSPVAQGRQVVDVVWSKNSISLKTRDIVSVVSKALYQRYAGILCDVTLVLRACAYRKFLTE